MKPQQAAATLAVADDTFLSFVANYAMPFMRGDAQYKKLMDAVAKNNPTLAAKIERLVAAEGEGITPAEVEDSRNGGEKIIPAAAEVRSGEFVRGVNPRTIPPNNTPAKNEKVPRVPERGKTSTAAKKIPTEAEKTAK
jgi:hypothetical protein